MQMRTVLIGVFALVFGVSAALGVYLLKSPAPATTKPETVSVVVAATEINRGQTISQKDLSTREWPKDMIPEGAITDLKVIEDQTVIVPLIKGDLLLEGKLAPKGSGRGMAAIVSEGMRAVTIQTPNVATGVAGFILPGNKVDILLTMTNQGPDDRTGGGSTVTLLQNVEILAVDQQIDVPQDNKVDSKDLRSVTLMVTPAQAARLDLAQNKGTLRLALRNAADKATEFVDPITMAGLMQNPNDLATKPRSTVPTEPAPLVAPPTARAMKVISSIRTLKGTRSGIIQLEIPNVDVEPDDSRTVIPPPPTPEAPTKSTTDPVVPLANTDL
jgi:pilus assembly protein CpaB